MVQCDIVAKDLHKLRLVGQRQTTVDKIMSGKFATMPHRIVMQSDHDDMHMHMHMHMYAELVTCF